MENRSRDKQLVLECLKDMQNDIRAWSSVLLDQLMKVTYIVPELPVLTK